MNKLEVKELPNDYFTLQGEMNRNTVAKSEALASLTKSCQNVVKGNVLTLDMSGVQHSDTAGLAWMMNFLKANQQENVSLKLTNIPESMLNLAKISDVDRFLSVQ